MKLMSIKNAYKMIEDISNIYGLDVNLTHGGTYIMKLEEFKKRVDDIVLKRRLVTNEDEYSCITINGVPIIDEYELLDANTINIHMPCKVFNISK